MRYAQPNNVEKGNLSQLILSHEIRVIALNVESWSPLFEHLTMTDIRHHGRWRSVVRSIQKTAWQKIRKGQHL